MTPDTIKDLMRRQDILTSGLRKYRRGSSVSFGDANTPPIISETFEVHGMPVQIETEDGIKIITPKARIVVFEADGSVDIIAGGIGSSVRENDASRLLDRSGKIKLTKSLRPKK